MEMPREWDAVRYDAQPLPHLDWGRRVHERLDPASDATVLDAGCGTGRDAQALLDRLPAGRVIAVDGSERMLARLRERLADRLDRVEVIRADLAEPHLSLPVEPVDAVASVAAFHWIHDHATLFANLARVLRPGGRLVSDCGGEGNIAGVTAALREVSGPDESGRTWRFAGVAETERLLVAAGFGDVEVRLRPDPVRLEEPAALHDYLRTVVLGAQLDRLPPSEHDDFVRAVADRLPEPVVDYVRLEISATRLPI